MSHLIECENLSKSYGMKRALTNVSFTCQAGEPIALVGPNGAGKTTLFSILCHYFNASSGSVKILGHKPGSKELFGQVAALPQDALLDPAFPLLRQLMFYAELKGFSRPKARIEAQRVLELMDLSESAGQLPTALSHGMCKRASIAQALLGSPKLVLLDEPTAGLDPNNAKNVRQQIAKLQGETTFLISSHNIQELEQLVDTVLHLEQGKLKQTLQHKNTQPQSNHQHFLTVELESLSSQDVINRLSELQGVESVKNNNKNEFVIGYDAQQVPDLDQKLLQTLADQSWQYRRLIKGKTLEEKLFS
jgi:ABC-2 type transport system ATP-binding protein